jgi:hypothetical protein
LASKMWQKDASFASKMCQKDASFASKMWQKDASFASKMCQKVETGKFQIPLLITKGILRKSLC